MLHFIEVYLYLIFFCKVYCKYGNLQPENQSEINVFSYDVWTTSNKRVEIKYITLEETRTSILENIHMLLPTLGYKRTLFKLQTLSPLAHSTPTCPFFSVFISVD